MPVLAPTRKSNLWKTKTNKTDGYPSNYMDVFLKGVKSGKKDGVKEFKEEFMKKVSENKGKAEKFAEVFFHDLNSDIKDTCSAVFLKSETYCNFRLIFIVKEEAYLLDEFDNFYTKSLEERKKVNSDAFYISMMFIPEVKTLNKNKMYADGFTQYYDGKGRK